MLMGAEVQVQNLMIYSTSPQARRDAKQMLESYEFNVVLDEDGKSRSAEILNATLKVMGVACEFKKVPIKYNDIATEQQHTLFYFVDWDSNGLFTDVNEAQSKLFVPYDNNQDIDALFVPVDKAQGQLFKFMGDE